MKKCVRCEKEKNESEFYPKDSSCKECRKAQKKGKVVVEPMLPIDTESTETHFRKGENDETDSAHHYDDEPFWIVETYSKVVAEYMKKEGANQIESKIDGWLFKVDARLLILFIAKTSGTVVKLEREPKKHKSEFRAQLAANMEKVRAEKLKKQ